MILTIISFDSHYKILDKVYWENYVMKTLSQNKSENIVNTVTLTQHSLCRSP